MRVADLKFAVAAACLCAVTACRGTEPTPAVTAPVSDTLVLRSPSPVPTLGALRAGPVVVPQSAKKLCGGGAFVIGTTTFDVRATDSGPNGTPFSGCMVAYDSVTKTAYLSLVCDARASCTGAQIMTHATTSFGVYETTVVGPVNQLPPAIVLGEFLYPFKTKASDVVDGTREIDVEWAQWGKSTSPYLNFSVWPDQLGLAGFTCLGTVPTSNESAGSATAFTSRILWQSIGVYFETFTGRSDAAIGKVVAPSRRDLRYVPPRLLQVPQAPELFYFNLWRFGTVTTGLQNYAVTVAITDYRFTPTVMPLPSATQSLGC